MIKSNFIYTNGLIIGRFLPFHMGHCFLIDTARSMCKNVYVCVCSKKDDSIPGTMRCMWIKGHYSARFVIDDHPYGKVIVKHITKEIQNAHVSNNNAPRIWADEILLALNKRFDAVFASESYGVRFAKYINACFVPVDMHRDTMPTSGALIRKNPLLYWKYLPLIVQRTMSCIVGVKGDKKCIQRFIKRTKASVYIPYTQRCKNSMLSRSAIKEASLAELHALCLYGSPVICILLPSKKDKYILEYEQCRHVFTLTSDEALRKAYKTIDEMLFHLL